MTLEVPIPAGKLFCFSQGEYSDYNNAGHFLALVEISQAVFETAKDRVKAKIIEAGEWREYDWEDLRPVAEMDDYDWRQALWKSFVPELIHMGVVLDIDCTEVHLGSYGTLEL